MVANDVTEPGVHKSALKRGAGWSDFAGVEGAVARWSAETGAHWRRSSCVRVESRIRGKVTETYPPPANET